jgi:hypothetical protein
MDTVGYGLDAGCGRRGCSVRIVVKKAMQLIVLTSSIVMVMVATAMPAIAANGEDDGIRSSTQIAVLIVTILAFAAAAFEGRRVLQSRETDAPAIRADLIDFDLFEIWPRSSNEPRSVRVFEFVLLSILILYAAGDRGFAWFHVPGTPLFVGEITLVIGAWAMISSPVRITAAIRHSSALKALIVWMVWGSIFLVLQFPAFGIDAIRDSAIWYYGVVAIFTVFLLRSDPSRFGRWLNLYARALPFLLLWLPVAMALRTVFGQSAPYTPFSVVSLFDHGEGNVAVHAGVALGFIWLVDRELKILSTPQRMIYTALATVGILGAGFQNRGGLVAAFTGLALMLVFLRRRRGEFALTIAAVVVALAAFMIVADVKIPISTNRDISTAQMVDNIGSIINPSSGDDRQTGTTEWRLRLWTAVLNDVITDRPLTGFGPGPHLGDRYGVAGGNEEVPLRNPHNSHLGVLARMGFVGAGMWLVLWIVWAFQLLLLHYQLSRRNRFVEAGVAGWLLVSAFMVLVNAFFDPTVEGPQVAFLLWFLFGFGVALPLFLYGHGGSMRIVRGAGSEVVQDAGPNPASNTPLNP